MDKGIEAAAYLICRETHGTCQCGREPPEPACATYHGMARAAVVAFARARADDPSLNGGPIAAWLDAEADRLEADRG